MPKNESEEEATKASARAQFPRIGEYRWLHWCTRLFLNALLSCRLRPFAAAFVWEAMETTKTKLKKKARNMRGNETMKVVIRLMKSMLPT
jgi:hypothetical protein